MFNKKLEDVYVDIKSGQDGLSPSEAAERLAANGANELRSAKKKSWIVKLLMQFNNAMLIILMAAGLVSGILAIVEENYSDILESVLIFAIVIANAVIGFLQEVKAEGALSALSKMSSPYSKVMRGGELLRIPTKDVVKGDMVVLEAGDSVPCDIRLVSSASLQIEESALTGESVPSTKDANIVLDDKAPLGDRVNMAFMGSTVTYGRGRGIAVDTGMNTQMGHIADMLESTKQEQTPIQKKLASTGKVITIAVLAIAVAVFAVGLIRGGLGHVTESLMTAVALAVAAIPEGLPTVVTIVMAVGVQTMSKRKAIIRRMPAVETLGSTEVICSDKTGTLTLNQMTVVRTNTLTTKYINNESDNSEVFQMMMKTMTLCNDTVAKVDEGKISAMGDSTETALVIYSHKLGYFKSTMESESPRVDEIPFDSDRKRMSTVHAEKDSRRVYCKGGIDEILSVCTKIYDGDKVRDITAADSKVIRKTASEMSKSALRVLAYATKVLPKAEPVASIGTEAINYESELTYVGISGMIDPPRAEVIGAIQTAHRAGMIAVMITGDHRDTATAIARELGMIKDESEVTTGAELDKMTDDQFFAAVTKLRVYARVSPANKVRIVQMWKKHGKIVAMTGDGVNDAPSIKSADIGIGMGITGTDVTKNVADMVLADDNFATIVVAVEEGRKIYSNILKSLQFLLSANVGEVIAIFIATLLMVNGEVFLTPLMILWVNLVTDTLPALALGMEKAEFDLMSQPPRKSGGSLFSGSLGYSIIYQGLLQGAIVLSVFYLSMFSFAPGDNITATTMAFMTMILIQLLHTLNCRSLTNTTFRIPLSKYIVGALAISLALSLIVVFVPGINAAFGLTALSLAQFGICLLAALIMMVVVELVKLVTRAIHNRKV